MQIQQDIFLSIQTRINYFCGQIKQFQGTQNKFIFTKERVEALKRISTLVNQIFTSNNFSQEIQSKISNLKEELDCLIQAPIADSAASILTEDDIEKCQALKQKVNEIYKQIFSCQKASESQQISEDDDAEAIFLAWQIEQEASLFEQNYPKTINFSLKLIDLLGEGTYGKKFQKDIAQLSQHILDQYAFFKIMVIHLCKLGGDLSDLDCFPLDETYVSLFKTIKEVICHFDNEKVTTFFYEENIELDIELECLKALNTLVYSTPIKPHQYLGLLALIQKLIELPDLEKKVLLSLYEGNIEEAIFLAENSIAQEVFPELAYSIARKIIYNHTEQAINLLQKILPEEQKDAVFTALIQIIAPTDIRLAIHLLPYLSQNDDREELFKHLMQFITAENAPFFLEALENFFKQYEKALLLSLIKALKTQDHQLAIELALKIPQNYENERFILLEEIIEAIIPKDYLQAIALTKLHFSKNKFYMGRLFKSIIKFILNKDLELAIQITTAQLVNISNNEELNNYIGFQLVSVINKKLVKTDSKRTIALTKKVPGIHYQAKLLRDIAQYFITNKLNEACSIIEQIDNELALFYLLKSQIEQFLEPGYLKNISQIIQSIECSSTPAEVLTIITQSIFPNHPRLSLSLAREIKTSAKQIKILRFAAFNSLPHASMLSLALIQKITDAKEHAKLFKDLIALALKLEPKSIENLIEKIEKAKFPQPIDLLQTIATLLPTKDLAFYLLHKIAANSLEIQVLQSMASSLFDLRSHSTSLSSSTQLSILIRQIINDPSLHNDLLQVLTLHLYDKCGNYRKEGEELISALAIFITPNNDELALQFVNRMVDGSQKEQTLASMAQILVFKDIDSAISIISPLKAAEKAHILAKMARKILKEHPKKALSIAKSIPNNFNSIRTILLKDIIDYVLPINKEFAFIVAKEINEENERLKLLGVITEYGMNKDLKVNLPAKEMVEISIVTSNKFNPEITKGRFFSLFLNSSFKFIGIWIWNPLQAIFKWLNKLAFSNRQNK